MKRITQIESKKQITYRWWRGDGKAIKPSHVGALEEKAQDRISEMMAQGYSSGELLDNVRTSRDPEDGTDYTGYWEVKTIEDGVEPPWLTQVKEALTHASKSCHHPSCKCSRGLPEFYCTCHVKKSREALTQINKD